MEGQGYTVQRGGYHYFAPEDCLTLTSCYANNPSSPYGIIMLPKGPSEDVSTYSKWGAILKKEVDGVEMSSSYRLDVGETVVMLGQKPPRSLYYSFVPYLFDRWYPENYAFRLGGRPGTCPNVTNPDGERCEIFASLGSPINMLEMNTKGRESFSSEFALFMGGDKSQVEHIKAMGVEVGIESSVQNVFPISTEKVNLGLTPISDGLMTLDRTAFTENEIEKQQYFNNPSTYITILRITPPANRTPGPAFRPKSFKGRITELEEVPSDGLSHMDLQSAVRELGYRARQVYQNTFPYAYNFSVQAPAFENGYQCIAYGIMCNGDNQDTFYPNSLESVIQNIQCIQAKGDQCPIIIRTSLQEDGSDFFLVTGVNHNATERGLYSSISMYNAAKIESLGAFSSPLTSDTYVGSANRFGMNPDVSKYLYAVKVTRRCNENEPFCLEVPTEGSNSLPVNGSILFMERIYLDHMYTGPADGATVKPIIYHFSTKLFI